MKKTTKSKVSHSQENSSNLSLFRINLPDSLGKGGDVTDYFVKQKGNIDEFMDLAEKIEIDTENSDEDNQVKRVAKIDKPEKEINFNDWKNTIQTNFPDLLFPAEIGISIMSQILIKDITNPFALVFVDVPSSGKTICINFFSEIEGLTYATDKFSPASFVSNVANVSKDKLKDIDMLPRIRYKMFLLRDLATMFSKRDDDLAELMGTLTRVLDGEGLNTDSGVHGGRKYVGEYLFMLLAGSTPLPPKIWKIMGNLGSRLFFLNLNSKEKSEEEMVEQLTTSAYKKKEGECRIVTKDFLYTLWNKYPNGVEWDKIKDNDKYKAVIIKCAKLLALLRGTINTWKDNLGDSFDSGHITTNIEKSYRIGQLFYNLCRGHALACERNQISENDLRLLIDIAIDSAPNIRARLFRGLLDRNGSMTTLEVENYLNCSKPTALKEMDVLKILGVCEIKQENYNTVGNSEKIMHLNNDFKWFLSDECKKLQNIPIDPKQSIMSDLLNQ